MTAEAEGTRALAGALLRGEPLFGPSLVVTEGPGAGRRLALGSAQTLGRGREADLRLEDPGASRVHARLAREGARWMATDLGSKNGLRVNGRRCRRPRALQAGDELTVGGTRLRFDAGAREPAAAAPPSGPRGPSGLAPGREARRRAPSARARLLAAALALLAAAALLLLAGPA